MLREDVNSFVLTPASVTRRAKRAPDVRGSGSVDRQTERRLDALNERKGNWAAKFRLYTKHIVPIGRNLERKE